LQVERGAKGVFLWIRFRALRTHPVPEAGDFTVFGMIVGQAGVSEKSHPLTDDSPWCVNRGAQTHNEKRDPSLSTEIPCFLMAGRWDLNPRPTVWQDDGCCLTPMYFI